MWYRYGHVNAATRQDVNKCHYVRLFARQSHGLIKASVSFSQRGRHARNTPGTSFSTRWCCQGCHVHTHLSQGDCAEREEVGGENVCLLFFKIKYLISVFLKNVWVKHLKCRDWNTHTWRCTHHWDKWQAFVVSFFFINCIFFSIKGQNGCVNRIMQTTARKHRQWFSQYNWTETPKQVRQKLKSKVCPMTIGQHYKNWNKNKQTKQKKQP